MKKSNCVALVTQLDVYLINKFKNLMKYCKNFIVMLLLMSCVDRQKTIENYTPENIIDVSFHENQEELSEFFNLIKEINIIPLEYDTSMFFSNKYQAKISDGNFYLLDKKQKKLFFFALTGKYIGQIDQYGKGPTEYIQPSNFDVNDKSEILIYDQARKNILLYDEKGIFKYSISADCAADNVAFFDDTLFVAYTKTLTLFQKDQNCVRIINREGNSLKSFFPIPKWIRNSSLSLSNGNHFVLDRKSVKLALPWCDNIFTITKDSIFCSYFINFGNEKIPLSFLSNNEDRIEKDFDKILKQLTENQWAWSIDNFHETNDHVFFQFLKEKDLYYALSERLTNETTVIKFSSIPVEWALVIKPFICTDDDKFYTLVSIGQLNNLNKLARINSDVLLKFKKQYDIYKLNQGKYLNDDDLLLISVEYK